jgi:hypothetical protein
MSKSILLRTANRRPHTAVSGLPFNDENVKLNLSSIGGNALMEGVAVYDRLYEGQEYQADMQGKIIKLNCKSFSIYYK